LACTYVVESSGTVMLRSAAATLKLGASFTADGHSSR
jgi:hypothetical protein